MPDGTVGNAAGPDWLVLGTEAGFLQKPVILTSSSAWMQQPSSSGSLITGNAERWDVLVDFTGLQAGRSFFTTMHRPHSPAATRGTII